jgi:hypothetical protein
MEAAPYPPGIHNGSVFLPQDYVDGVNIRGYGTSGRLFGGRVLPSIRSRPHSQLAE